MATTRSNQGAPAAPVPPSLVVAIGAVATGAAAWPGFLPWAAVALVSVIVAGFMAAPPQLTGKKDAAGFPTAADPNQERQITSYRMWSQLKGSALMPGAHWWAGNNLRFSWLYACAVVLIQVASPMDVRVLDYAWWAPAAAAIAGFAVVTGFDGAYRTSRTPYDPCPGAGVEDLRKVSAPSALLAVFACIVGAGAGVGAWAATTKITWAPEGTAVFAPAWVGAIGVGLAVASAIVHMVVRSAALAEWRDTVAARQLWDARWPALKQFTVDHPQLVAHTRIGSAQVDTFEVPAALGTAQSFICTHAPAVTQVVGAGAVTVVLHVPSTDPNTGQDIPGTTHPSRVKIATWQVGSMPSPCDVDVEDDLAQLLLECAITQAIMKFNPSYVRPIWMGATCVSEDPAQADAEPDDDEAAATPASDPVGKVWAIELQMTPISVDWTMLNRDMLGFLEEATGTDVVIARRDPARLFVGPFDEATLSSSLPRTATYAKETPQRYLDDIREELQWNVRWGAIKGVGGNIPTPQFLVRASNRLLSGAEVHYVPFVCRDGAPPDVMGLFTQNAEQQMATGLTAAPFCSIQTFPRDQSRPDGERHPQAVVVVYSASKVPLSPAMLAPGSLQNQRASAPYWVLRAMFDRAFDAAKLARPEVVEATALTNPTSSRHVWKVRMRLHHTTLASVRAAQSKIAGALGVGWVRFAPDSQEGFVLVYAGDPTRATFTNQERSEKLVASLNWEQGFAESNIVGANGRTPTLTERVTMERNEKVEVLDFDLPSPISVERLRGVEAKLRAATGNMFLDIRTGEKGAQSARIICCSEDPMPFPADFDWDAIDDAVDAETLTMPFATGVDGEPVSLDITKSPHVLVAGQTGSGKSVVMQSFGFAAAAHHWLLYVIDPSKGAADFKFLAPYSAAIATEVHEAAGVMKQVSMELDRRKALNSVHGVDSYRRLPADVRPAHMLVMIDEFTSLTAVEQVSTRASDNIEVEMARAAAIEANDARLGIGSVVGRIAREARSVGITLVLGTQKLAVKDLDAIPGASTLKTNLGRILMGSTTYGDRQSALRNPDMAPSLGEVIPPGRGLFESAQGMPKIIQSWFDAGGQVALAEQLEARRDALSSDDQLDLDVFAVDPNGGLAGLLGGDDIDLDEEGDREDVVEDLGTITMDWSTLWLGDTEAGQPDDATGSDDEPNTILPSELIDLEWDEPLPEPTPLPVDADEDVAESARQNLPPAARDTVRVVVGDGAHLLATHDLGTFTLAGQMSGVERLDAVVAWLTGAGETTTLVWVDDMLGEVDPVFDVPWRDLAAEMLDTVGVGDRILATTDDLPLTVAGVTLALPEQGSEPASAVTQQKPRRPPAIANLWAEGETGF